MAFPLLVLLICKREKYRWESKKKNIFITNRKHPSYIFTEFPHCFLILFKSTVCGIFPNIFKDYIVYCFEQVPILILVIWNSILHCNTRVFCIYRLVKQKTWDLKRNDKSKLWYFDLMSCKTREECKVFIDLLLSQLRSQD